MKMEGRHERLPLLEMTNTNRAPSELVRYKKMNIISRFQFGGQFEIMGDRLFYKKGQVYAKDDVNPRVDSKKLIELKSGMVFGSNDIFRMTLSKKPIVSIRWRLSAFKNRVLREHNVKISTSQACRARMCAYLMCQGDAKKQNGKVWNYVVTIMKWHPGSSTYVKVNSLQRPVFQRLYVYLDACKKGFLDGCRPILGLDGCHLKGAYTGQILTAVGKDGNENIFPVAFAVVEAKRKETWVWFLENLVKDLGYASIIFMPDRQKGLTEALQHVVPMAEKRVCVRHLYNNFIVKWSGRAFKDALWAAARATIKVDFDEAMNFIKKADEGAFSYLMRVDPRTWSNHAFKPSCKSDMLLNNVCETFNNYILDARELSAYTHNV